MPKVMIIGPSYYNYTDSCKAAFERAGYETVVENFDTPVHPYTSLMRILYKLSVNKKAFRQKNTIRYNRYIKVQFNESNPNIVFILNGDFLLPETLDYFRKSAKTALWMFDNIEKIPQAEDHFNHVDALFCFDQKETALFGKCGKNVYFLPQACDTDKYFPIQCKKDLDIVFIGDMVYSEKRRRIANAVIERFPQCRIEMYGPYQPWYKGLITWILRPHKNIFKNRNTNSEESNEIYNRAKIALNIHKEYQKDGANPRVFEICGSGTYQICDANPYIESLFPNGEIGLYHNDEELFALIEEALDKNMSEQAEAAHTTVENKHSFDNRIGTVLAVINAI